MTKEYNVIDSIDYRGERVIFTHKKWKEKLTVHPELANKAFIRNLEKTIQSPDEVWEDYDDRKRKRCYYRKYSSFTYIKAVIWMANEPYKIVSAFETNKIKEAGYPKLKRLK